MRPTDLERLVLYRDNNSIVKLLLNTHAVLPSKYMWDPGLLFLCKVSHSYTFKFYVACMGILDCFSCVKFHIATFKVYVACMGIPDCFSCVKFHIASINERPIWFFGFGRFILRWHDDE